MGLINRLFGLGGSVREVAEVFTVNRTRAMEVAHERYQSTLGQFGQEFTHARQGWFDRFVDGLNRLPRPALALGTIGLFVYAMQDPDGFSVRMQGLAYVPEPLWWLLGAVVSFYFGARELHHFRSTGPSRAVPHATTNAQSEDNLALAEWRNAQS